MFTLQQVLQSSENNGNCLNMPPPPLYAYYVCKCVRFSVVERIHFFCVNVLSSFLYLINIAVNTLHSIYTLRILYAHTHTSLLMLAEQKYLFYRRTCSICYFSIFVFLYCCWLLLLLLGGRAQ